MLIQTGLATITCVRASQLSDSKMSSAKLTQQVLAARNMKGWGATPACRGVRIKTLLAQAGVIDYPANFGEWRGERWVSR
jgi:hypothetical protein